MSKLNTYSVRFIEWTLYEARFEATSEGKAIRLAMHELRHHGTKGFKCKNAGEESWEAEVVS
jgi:hypothetical protein